MANYRESSTTTTKHRRCCGIEISNPSAPRAPSIMFREQDVITIDGETTQIGADALLASFNPSREIELLDTDTLEPTGQTVTEGMIYLALFSKYIATALKRDAFVAQHLANPELLPGTPVPLFIEDAAVNAPAQAPAP